MAFWTHPKIDSAAVEERGQRRQGSPNDGTAPVPFRWIETDSASDGEPEGMDPRSFRDLLHRRSEELRPENEEVLAGKVSLFSPVQDFSPENQHFLPSALGDEEDSAPEVAPGISRRGIALPPRRATGQKPAQTIDADNPFALASPFSVVSPFRAAAESAAQSVSRREPAAPGEPGPGIRPSLAGSPLAPVVAETVAFPLARLLAGVSPDQLGFSPGSIPPEVEVSFDRATVREQLTRGRVAWSGADLKDRVSPAWREALMNLDDQQEIALPLALVISSLGAAADSVAAASSAGLQPQAPAPAALDANEATRSASPFGFPSGRPFAPWGAESVPPAAGDAEGSPSPVFVEAAAVTPLLPVEPVAVPASPAERGNGAFGGIRVQADSMPGQDRSQLPIRLLFGVKRPLGMQELLDLCESLEGVACAVLPDYGMASASAPADLAASALRIREHLRLLQEEIGGHGSEQHEFMSIDTQRGTLCFLETAGIRMIAQLRAGDLPHGSRERLYLLVDAIAGLSCQGYKG